MALFKKHLSLDEILKAVSAMSPEDKEKVRAAAEHASDAEETPAESETTEDTPETAEETDPGEEKTPDGETPAEETSAEETSAEEPAAEGTTEETPAPAAENADAEAAKADAEGTPNETAQDEEADEHGAEIIKALTDRVIALEESMKTLKALQNRMEEYDARNAEKFGYHGKPGDKRQDISEMSAAELKEKMLSGQR